MDGDFTIGISTDLKDFLHGIKEAKAGFDNLGKDASRALKTPQGDIDNLGIQLKSFSNIVKGTITGLAGAVGIKSLTMDFMNFHANLSNAVQVMGYDVTNVEALGGAMRRFGGDTSGAISSLDNLTTALQQASWGQGNLVETAQKYGITYMKNNGQLMDAEELLQSLSRELNTYDAQTKRAIASSLGLDNALLRVIDTGNFSQLINHQKQLNTTTKEDLKVATDFESAWLDLKDTMASFAKQISITILPWLTKLMRGMVKIAGTVSNLEQRFHIAWTGVAIAITPVVTKLLSLSNIVKMLTGGVVDISKGTGVFKALGLAMGALLKPANLIRGAFGLLFLVIDDLATYGRGGESVFGELVKQFPVLTSLATSVTGAFEHIGNTIDAVVNFFKDPSFFNFKKIIEPQIELVKGLFNDLIDYLKGIFSNLFDSITSGISSAINLPGQAVNKVGEVVGGGVSWVKDKVQGFLPPWLGGKPSATPPVVDGNVLGGVAGTPEISNQINTTNNFTITSTDPREAGKEVARAVQGQLQDAGGVLMKYQKP